MLESLKSVVATALSNAFQSLEVHPKSIVVLESKPDTGFHYQTAAALQFGGDAAAIAQQVVDILSADPGIAAAAVTGRGFVNVSIDPKVLSSIASIPRLSDGEKVVIDFGGPNIAKPLHVGHLRSLVIGESIRRVLLATGHDVVSDIHLGDWGLPMGQVVDAIERMGIPADDVAAQLTVADLERIYPEASAACKLDPERLVTARAATARLQSGDATAHAVWQVLRKMSLESVSTTIQRLGAHFDLLLGESDSAAAVPTMASDLVDAGLAVSSQGALVVHVAEPTDGERPMPPVILLRSDGSTSYHATDLATIVQRKSELGAERIVYVVDYRQAEHFVQLARAAAQWPAIADVSLVHAQFGTVDGPDGRPLKTRNGGAVRLDSLIEDAVSAAAGRMRFDDAVVAEAIGIGAIKFMDLSTVRSSGYAFDLDRALSFEGDTGPYVQYACVRMSSLLSKSQARAGDAAAIQGATGIALLLECARFSDAVSAAASELEPCRIAIQCLRIAKAFNRFYADADVLGSQDEPDRVALVALAHSRLSKGLDLLGMAEPNRM